MFIFNKLDHRPVGHEMPVLARRDSTAEFAPLGENSEVEYFFASDASAIIEHTNRVIFLEVIVIYFSFTKKIKLIYYHIG